MKQNDSTNDHNPRPADSAAESIHSSAPPNNQLYGETPPIVQASVDNAKHQPKRAKSSVFGGFFGTIQLVAGAILLAVFINSFIFQSYMVVGQSMQPTLENGDRLIINKVGRSWNSLFGGHHTPKRGQIIVFDSPISDTKQLVKRVIGLPGDRVEVDAGVITVFNDENPEGIDIDQEIADEVELDVNYKLSSDVDEGHLFVAGDNRVGGASLDSRNDLGLVPLDNIVGELILRLLPLSESRFF